MSLLPEVIKYIFTVSYSTQLCNYRIEALCECSDQDKKGEPRYVGHISKIMNMVLTKTLYFRWYTTLQLYNLYFIY